MFVSLSYSFFLVLVLRIVLLVTPRQIQDIYTRFYELDADGDGTLSTDDFLSIRELATNPLVMRVISVFDEKFCSHFSEYGVKKGVRKGEEKVLRWLFDCSLFFFNSEETIQLTLMLLLKQ